MDKRAKKRSGKRPHSNETFVTNEKPKCQQTSQEGREKLNFNIQREHHSESFRVNDFQREPQRHHGVEAKPGAECDGGRREFPSVFPLFLRTYVYQQSDGSPHEPQRQYISDRVNSQREPQSQHEPVLDRTRTKKLTRVEDFCCIARMPASETRRGKFAVRPLSST